MAGVLSYCRLYAHWEIRMQKLGILPVSGGAGVSSHAPLFGGNSCPLQHQGSQQRGGCRGGGLLPRRRGAGGPQQT